VIRNHQQPRIQCWFTLASRNKLQHDVGTSSALMHICRHDCEATSPPTAENRRLIPTTNTGLLWLPTQHHLSRLRKTTQRWAFGGRSELPASTPSCDLLACGTNSYPSDARSIVAVELPSASRSFAPPSPKSPVRVETKMWCSYQPSSGGWAARMPLQHVRSHEGTKGTLPDATGG
jgi:hypothetical protein